MAKTDKNEVVTVKVAKRKSVDLDGKLYGPDSLIKLPMDEAQDLFDKGFVVDPAGDGAEATDAETQAE